MAKAFHVNILIAFCAFTLLNINNSVCDPLDVGYWLRHLVNGDKSSMDMPMLPPIIKVFDNHPSQNGYNFSLRTHNGYFREEKFELKHRGTPDEEQLLNGKYTFNADDGFRYVVVYSSDKNGIMINFDMQPFKRIPPNALKTLVG